MKEDNKSNSRDINSDLNKKSENDDQKRKKEASSEKRLEDKPGAFLLRETAEDENRNAIKDDAFDDELNFDPFEEDDETQD